jgi:hypothetical protein
LTDAIRLWPTPNHHEQKRGPGFSAKDCHYAPHDLTTEVEMWRTPDARVMNEGEGQATFFARREELKKKGYNGNGAGIPLSIATTGWLTPRPLTGGYCYADPLTVTRKGIDANGIKRTLHLLNQAESWAFSPPDQPTPGGPPFYERVRILLQLCHQLKRLLPSPWNKTKALFKPKLNPDFVDWLQGLPPGFTSEEFDSSVMETWLSRCRRLCASVSSPES